MASIGKELVLLQPSFLGQEATALQYFFWRFADHSHLAWTKWSSDLLGLYEGMASQTAENWKRNILVWKMQTNDMIWYDMLWIWICICIDHERFSKEQKQGDVTTEGTKNRPALPLAVFLKTRKQKGLAGLLEAFSPDGVGGCESTCSMHVYTFKQDLFQEKFVEFTYLSWFSLRNIIEERFVLHPCWQDHAFRCVITWPLDLKTRIHRPTANLLRFFVASVKKHCCTAAARCASVAPEPCCDLRVLALGSPLGCLLARLRLWPVWILGGWSLRVTWHWTTTGRIRSSFGWLSCGFCGTRYLDFIKAAGGGIWFLRPFSLSFTSFLKASTVAFGWNDRSGFFQW